MKNEKEMKWQPIPSLKSEQIDDLFKSLYGVDRKTSIVEKLVFRVEQKLLKKDFVMIYHCVNSTFQDFAKYAKTKFLDLKKL